MSKIVVTVDSGADIPSERAQELGIRVVPFHLSVGEFHYHDGEIEPEEMLALCQEKKTFPKTSACRPYDYEMTFGEILEESPDAHIVHLGYSAATTSSFQSAQSAAERLGRVTCVDTRFASGAYGLVAGKLAHAVRSDQNLSVENATRLVDDLIARVKMAFMPTDLLFLKAGGRLSSMQFAASQMLSINPVVEMRNGVLSIAKKLRGSAERAATKFLDAFLHDRSIDRELLVLLYSCGLSPKIRAAATEKANDLGFREVYWVQAGCVVTAHCGPNAIGFAALQGERNPKT